MKRGFLSIKFHENPQKKLIQSLTEIFKEMNIQLYCFVRDEEFWGKQKYDPEEMMRRAFEHIKKSDVLIVDFTEKGIGVGIEAGYAAALGKPIVVIAPPEADISTTLIGTAQLVLPYHLPEDILLYEEKIDALFK